MHTFSLFTSAPRIQACAIAGLLCATAGWSDLDVTIAGDRLTVMDGPTPVLTYNGGRVDPPASVKADVPWRASYIHPLHAIDGTIITEDFPPDHYHHRGVFWAWPECRVGDRRVDTWAVDGVRQLRETWLDHTSGERHASFGVQNVWRITDDEIAVVRERVHVTVHEVSGNVRAIDFHLRFENVSGEAMVFEGAKNKGYGGFSFRAIAANRPLTFLSERGVEPEDALQLDTRWAGVFWNRPDSSVSDGVLIFQHPGNPGYPHDGWILRHYGLFGACWPHETPHTLSPGDSFELQYRLVVCSDRISKNRIARLYDTYLAGIAAAR